MRPLQAFVKANLNCLAIYCRVSPHRLKRRFDFRIRVAGIPLMAITLSLGFAYHVSTAVAQSTETIAETTEKMGGRALPHGTAPGDQRLNPLKDLNGYFPFTPYSSVPEWNARKTELRRQLLLACGIWPLPPKPVIHATIHGRVQREGYSVERVYFESTPGLYVTGSLYRPDEHTATNARRNGKRPVILCPHGHWSNGRFHDHGDAGIQRELDLGAEKFESGRHPLQARCVQLARMGCVVFHYDMLGYADSVPITYETAHRFAKQRPELNQPDHWGLFGTRAEQRLVNVMGLQTWNSLRAVDFVLQLDNVDPKRVGVTGASGGGTQSFMLAALDERISAAFPAVMVSTAMQGGCTCENACYLRVGTGNIEMAALVAPRPLGLSAADDWTKELEIKGLPELKQHYRLLGAANNITGRYFPYKHNFNAVSRRMMLGFFNRHFELNEQNLGERDFDPLTIDEMTVWNEKHPKPASTSDEEVSAVQAWYEFTRQRVTKLETFHTVDEFVEYRKTIRTALRTMLCRDLPRADNLTFETIKETERQRYIDYRGLLHEASSRDALPVIFLLPKQWNQRVVVLVSEQGKNEFFTESGYANPSVEKFVDAGYAIAAYDAYLQGELVKPGQPKPITLAPRVNNPREFAGYTLGYNPPVFAQRVHDALKVLTFAQHHSAKPDAVYLAGQGWGAIAAAAANAVCDRPPSGLAIDTHGLRFDDLTDIRDMNLWPGMVKYGDVPALLAVGSSTPLWLAGERGQLPSLTERAVRCNPTAPNAASVVVKQDPLPAMLDWLELKNRQ